MDREALEQRALTDPALPLGQDEPDTDDSARHLLAGLVAMFAIVSAVHLVFVMTHDVPLPASSVPASVQPGKPALHPMEHEAVRKPRSLIV